MKDRVDGSAFAGGLIAAATLDKLTAKGILSLDEAREILDKALRAIGSPAMQTPEGYAAAQIITGLLGGQYSKRVVRE